MDSVDTYLPRSEQCVYTTYLKTVCLYYIIFKKRGARYSHNVVGNAQLPSEVKAIYIKQTNTFYNLPSDENVLHLLSVRQLWLLCKVKNFKVDDNIQITQNKMMMITTETNYS